MDYLTQEDVFHAVDQVVEELLEKRSMHTPPIDALTLAEKHFRATIRDPDRSELELQWESAQLIGKELKPRIYQRLGIDPTQRIRGPSIPNIFAKHLLLPTTWLRRDSAELNYDLLALQELYSSVSHEMLAFRWLDFPDPCIVTIIDNEEVYRRKSNGSSIKKELSVVEAECLQIILEGDEPADARRAGWTVQGWPIPHEVWDRIILRSTVDPESFSD